MRGEPESGPLDTSDFGGVNEERWLELAGDDPRGVVFQLGVHAFQVELIAQQVPAEGLEPIGHLWAIGDVSRDFAAHIDQVIDRELGGDLASAFLVDGVESAQTVVFLSVRNRLFDLPEEPKGDVGRGHELEQAAELSDRCRSLSRRVETIAKIRVAVLVVEGILEATERCDGVVTASDLDGVLECRTHRHHPIRADLTQHREKALNASVTVEWHVEGNAGEVNVVVHHEALSAEGFKHGTNNAIMIGDWGVTNDVLAEVVEIENTPSGFAIGETDSSASLDLVVDIDDPRPVHLLEPVEDILGGEQPEDRIRLADQAQQGIAETIRRGEFVAINDDGSRNIRRPDASRGNVADFGDWKGDGLDVWDEGRIEFHWICFVFLV